MRLLILGGTAWLGRHVAVAALQSGHDVTCLARGQSGAVPEGVRFMVVDRDVPGSCDSLAGEEWDAVIDLSRQPGQVRDAAMALAGSSRHFVFVSSSSVYADHSLVGADETAALLPALDGDVMKDMATYGSAKVSCEQHVLRAFGEDRCLVARVGLIGGPGDPFDRSGYWPLRFARPSGPDERVLVPDVAELATQLIDVRDVAVWLVEAASCGLGGIYNVVGETMPFFAHLDVAMAAGRVARPWVKVAPERLQALGVSPWMGARSLPLWLPLPSHAGFSARSCDRALGAGPQRRSLLQTLVDTLDWELDDPTRSRRAGLSDEAERELLAAVEVE